MLGDGIEHVQTTPSGEIWVGYFDEGIGGNFGWGGPRGPEPIGASGLVRFSAGLERVWTFPEDPPYGGISDCYALNVAGEDAWACYYMDFPVVRVSGDEVTAWENTVEDARALVVADGRATVVGVHPALTGARVTGRGAELHVVAGTEWLKAGGL
ncbi:hypothetical protein [Herbidospora cretacea]|uniref:hypothetical protein n=1 Tax=Herbidospora cretacea TaxID=28444 RepID=UPI000774D0D9|nr:hypothetical protein [Herbidospora cretacea]